MTIDADDAPADLIRWTFAVEPEKAPAIAEHLDDFGADAWHRGEGSFQVTWEEPEGDLNGIVEALWAIHGSPFDITQEAFRRIDLHVLQHESGDSGALEAA